MTQTELRIKDINYHSKFSCLRPWFPISIVAFEDEQIAMNITNYKLVVLFKTSQHRSTKNSCTATWESNQSYQTHTRLLQQHSF